MAMSPGAVRLEEKRNPVATALRPTLSDPIQRIQHVDQKTQRAVRRTLALTADSKGSGRGPLVKSKPMGKPLT